MHALRIHVPGDFEDAFLYMDHIVAVGGDRALMWTSLGKLLHDTLPTQLEALGELFFRRNDLLAQEGTATLLRDPSVRLLVQTTFARNEEAFLAEPSDWFTSGEYARLLGTAYVLDLHIYNQRLYLGTTEGLLHADLTTESEDEFFLSRLAKRTDARCLSIATRFGTLAASCEDAGLLVAYDEFAELGHGTGSSLAKVSSRSTRTAWLGYNLVNYLTSAEAVGLKASYETLWDRGRRAAVVTDLQTSESLLAPETASWDGADFAFNDHSTFFVHWPSKEFQVHRRTWARGRLGRRVDVLSGEIDRPLSAGSVLAGLVIETYDALWLLSGPVPELLHRGEAIAVRTFPNSVRYRNVIVAVDDEGLHLISPLRMEAKSDDSAR